MNALLGGSLHARMEAPAFRSTSWTSEPVWINIQRLGVTAPTTRQAPTVSRSWNVNQTCAGPMPSVSFPATRPIALANPASWSERGQNR